MPLIAQSETRVSGFAVHSFLGSAVQLVALFVSISSGTVLHAQTIEVKLVNGKTGQPITNTCVNTWVGTERKEAMAIPMDKDGAASLYLTDKDSDVNSQGRAQSCGDFGVVHPVVKYADKIRIVAGYAVCQPHAPDYSWLATMEFPTNQIVHQGIVTTNVCGKPRPPRTPGSWLSLSAP